MTDKPMIFSGPMVLALLSGAKTQTRRIITAEPATSRVREGSHLVTEGCGFVRQVVGHFRPRWRTGDRLWGREAWQEFLLSEHPSGRPVGPRGRFGIPAESAKGNVSHVGYRGDGEWPDHPELGKARWMSPIHMPRWASRLTLLVTDVRVERLQDISREDVIAEGFDTYEGQPVASMVAGWHQPYAQYWDQLHGAGAWAKNPWVAAISFDPIAANIDSLPPERSAA